MRKITHWVLHGVCLVFASVSTVLKVVVFKPFGNTDFLIRRVTSFNPIMCSVKWLLRSAGGIVTITPNSCSYSFDGWRPTPDFQCKLLCGQFIFVMYLVYITSVAVRV